MIAIIKASDDGESSNDHSIRMPTSFLLSGGGSVNPQYSLLCCALGIAILAIRYWRGDDDDDGSAPPGLGLGLRPLGPPPGLAVHEFQEPFAHPVRTRFTTHTLRRFPSTRSPYYGAFRLPHGLMPLTKSHHIKTTKTCTVSKGNRCGGVRNLHAGIR